MKQIKLENCYWCNNPATTTEHVPPKCFFPEDKDTNGCYDYSLKKNLITVPSCCTHNTQKSGNDEYLFTHISTIVGNNDVGYLQTHTKVSRAYSHNRTKFDIVKKGDYTYMFDEKKSFTEPAFLVYVDTDKILNSIEAIARALYFNNKNIPFDGFFMCFSPMLSKSSNTNFNKKQLAMLEILESNSFVYGDKIGENNNVFYYQIGCQNTSDGADVVLPDCIIYKIVFYENCIFYAILHR